MEYQDGGLGYTSVAEVEVKEHPIDGERATPQESRRKIISRDPRRQSDTLASPSTLYGTTTSPMDNPLNVAQPAQGDSHTTHTLMEESDGEPSLVIDIVNNESE